MKHECHMSKPGGEQLPGADPWEYAFIILLGVGVMALLALTPFLARL